MNWNFEEGIMVKKNRICILVFALIMLIFPWCTVTFIKGGAGMAACVWLLFAVNPITVIGVGIFAGRNLKTSWFQPIFLAILFLFGAWIFFAMKEPAFILYAAVYLVLGVFVMLFTSLFTIIIKK